MVIFQANEPRKPTDRKAVKRAYQNALSHLNQISSNEPAASSSTSV